VPDAGDRGDCKDWDVAYRKWLVRRGLIHEIQRIESIVQRSKRKGRKT
jgi:hypothetical protein